MKVIRIFSSVKQVIIKYPMTVLAAFFLYVVMFVMVNMEHTTWMKVNMYNFFRLAVVAGTAIGLFFALNIIGEKWQAKRMINLLGILILVGYYFLLPVEYSSSAEEKFLFTFIPISVLVHLLISVAPFLYKVENEQSFWNYNKNLFINFLLANAFAGVLVLGVLSATAIFSALFDIKIHGKVYFNMLLPMSIMGNTLIFLLFVNRDEQEDRSTYDTFPVVLKFFIQYITLPIIILYLAILYLYTVKILIVWELPKGWLSYAIIGYSLVGILAVLLVYPLRNERKKSWVFWFFKFFYYSLIPLVILLFVAIFTRLLDYGITEPRYYVLLLATWLSIIVLYFILKKNPTIAFVPKSLILAILLALFCPYINAFSVAKRSQVYEFKRLLEENNLLINGKINFEAPIKRSVLNQLKDKMTFIKNRGAQKDIVSYFKEGETPLLTSNDFKHLIEDDDIKEPSAAVEEVTLPAETWVFYGENTEDVIAFDGKGWIFICNRIDDDSCSIDNGKKLVISRRKNDELNITLDGATVDFMPDIRLWIKENTSKNTKAGRVPLLFTKRIKDYAVTAYLNDIRVTRLENSMEIEVDLAYVKVIKR